MIELRTEDVFAGFSALYGAEDAERFLPLCDGAAAQLEAGERPSCVESGRGALTAAAAALAFYRYILARGGTGEESFSVGDVKIASGAGNAESARKLWQEAAVAASPYLTDTGCFLFGRIL